MDSSILLISLPDILKGLHVNPLVPRETGNLFLAGGSAILTLLATLFSVSRGERFIYEEAGADQRRVIDAALGQPILQDAIEAGVKYSTASIIVWNRPSFYKTICSFELMR